MGLTEAIKDLKRRLGVNRHPQQSAYQNSHKKPSTKGKERAWINETDVPPSEFELSRRNSAEARILAARSLDLLQPPPPCPEGRRLTNGAPPTASAAGPSTTPAVTFRRDSQYDVVHAINAEQRERLGREEALIRTYALSNKATRGFMATLFHEVNGRTPIAPRDIQLAAIMYARIMEEEQLDSTYLRQRERMVAELKEMQCQLEADPGNEIWRRSERVLQECYREIWHPCAAGSGAVKKPVQGTSKKCQDHAQDESYHHARKDLAQPICALAAAGVAVRDFAYPPPRSADVKVTGMPESPLSPSKKRSIQHNSSRDAANPSREAWTPILASEDAALLRHFAPSELEQARRPWHAASSVSSSCRKPERRRPFAPVKEQERSTKSALNPLGKFRGGSAPKGSDAASMKREIWDVVEEEVTNARVDRSTLAQRRRCPVLLPPRTSSLTKLDSETERVVPANAEGSRHRRQSSKVDSPISSSDAKSVPQRPGCQVGGPGICAGFGVQPEEGEAYEMQDLKDKRRLTRAVGIA